MFSRLLAWILRNWADRTTAASLDLEREDHRATKAELAQAKAQNVLLTAEVEFLANWRAKELSRLDWENAIFRGRKTLGEEGPMHES